MPKVNNRLPFDVVFKVSKAYKRGGARRPSLLLAQQTYLGRRSAVFAHQSSGLGIVVDELEARGSRVKISLSLPRKSVDEGPVSVHGSTGHALADSYIRALRASVERRGLELRLVGDDVSPEPCLGDRAYRVVDYSVHRPAVGQQD